jgi:hypothetical protein
MLVYGAGLAICTACAVCAPLLLAKFHPTLRIGYYVWIGALLLSLVAAISQLLDSKAQLRPAEDIQTSNNEQQAEIP